MVKCEVPGCVNEASTMNQELNAYLCTWHNYFEELPTTRALLELLAGIGCDAWNRQEALHALSDLDEILRLLRMLLGDISEWTQIPGPTITNSSVDETSDGSVTAWLLDRDILPCSVQVAGVLDFNVLTQEMIPHTNDSQVTNDAIISEILGCLVEIESGERMLETLQVSIEADWSGGEGSGLSPLEMIPETSDGSLTEFAISEPTLEETYTGDVG